MEHDIQNGFALSNWKHTVFAQVLPYVLHIDYGIVYQRTDGNSHTSQTHGVDAEPHIVKYQNSHHQRQRECDQRNDSGTCVGKEKEKHDDNEDGSFVQRFLYVADGAFDETRLSEDIGRNLYVCRKILL